MQHMLLRYIKMTNHSENSAQEKIPVAIDRWEAVLVRHFLAVQPGGDASDIFTIEVSAETLALACGIDVSYAQEVELAFRDTLLRDEAHLIHALKLGSFRLSTIEVPNYFALLAMTLLIDSLLDGDYYENNQFRAKLASWLGVERTFSDLSGVKVMWESLRDWLDAQVLAGRPFRRLILPVHPKTWVHIGYTRKLSFPNRADVRAVVRVLDGTVLADFGNPVIIISAFLNCPYFHSLSIGLKEAFEDFQRAYYSQRRALADHRFWLLIQKFRAARVVGISTYLRLEIAYTMDDEREFRLAAQDADDFFSFQTLTEALGHHAIATGANLSAGVSRGMLFFTQVGMARWVAEPDLAKCRGKVLVAYHVKVAERIMNWVGQVVRYDGWRLSVDPMNVDSIAANLGLESNGASVFRPSASDGIKVRGAWLGLPGFMPLIKSDTSDLCIFAQPRTADLCMSVGDDLRLSAASPATGMCVIEPKPAPNERGPHWRLKLQFVDRSAPHYELRGARRDQPLLADWSSVSAVGAECLMPNAVEWLHADDPVEWLLEAIYASGASGWDECDLVDLLKRADAEVTASPWRMLKMLHDGSVIEPRLRRGWKGRVWILSPPRIVFLRSASGPVALAEGAFCMQMRDAFFTVVKGMGGVPFRLCSEARWSVPVMGAVGVDPEKLAAILKWDYTPCPEMPLAAQHALVTTERRAEHYLSVATWSWSTRRFTKTITDESEVRLTLLAHPGGIDHDVYRLEARGAHTHFLSRCAAVVAAHGAAGVPLFEFDGQRLISTTSEASLPDMLSVALRRRRLINGGFADGAYFYAATTEDAHWLALLLPGCIAGLDHCSPIAPGAVLARVRHSNGSVRSKWINGQLTY